MNGLRHVPGTGALRRTMLWGRLRHKMSLLVGERANSHFTGFLRLPTQFQALTGPVLSQLRDRGAHSTPLRIAVLGCSNGAEAFTIASVLARHDPTLTFHIRGYDIDGAVVAKATSARYAPDEIFNNKIITDDFVSSTFDRDGDTYVVKPHIAERAQFAVADVLSSDLLEVVGGCDLVFAQNFIFHLKRDAARAALENISRLLRPGAVLFADGVDLDLRSTFARRKRLIPLDYEIHKIHDEARRARAIGWPYEYWGLEPFLTSRRDWRTRYSTIFYSP